MRRKLDKRYFNLQPGVTFSSIVVQDWKSGILILQFFVYIVLWTFASLPLPSSVNLRFFFLWLFFSHLKFVVISVFLVVKHIPNVCYLQTSAFFYINITNTSPITTYPHKKKNDICKFHSVTNTLNIRWLCLDCTHHFQHATSQGYILTETSR